MVCSSHQSLFMMRKAEIDAKHTTKYQIKHIHHELPGSLKWFSAAYPSLYMQGGFYEVQASSGLQEIPIGKIMIFKAFSTVQINTKVNETTTILTKSQSLERSERKRQ